MTDFKYERTVWNYKEIEEDDLSNKNLEIILTFYDKNRFELNINKFSSKFNLDLDEFLSNNSEKNEKLSDDVFESDYHHSLILGSFHSDDNGYLNLMMEKIFTNEQNKYNENEKEILMSRNDDGTIEFDKQSMFSQLSYNKDNEIKLKMIRSINE